MSKRFQIPASPRDHKLFQSAARKAGLSAAEWARRLLRREAEQQIQGKSWDRLFSELREVPDSGSWEVPERKPARPVKSADDWR